jgi:hypothetical protein
MRHTITLLLLATAFLACQPEELPDGCAVENISQLTLHNTVDSPVDIYLDSTFQTSLAPAEETTLEVPAGIYRLYVEEAASETGATFYWETNLQLFRCQERKLAVAR